jgi:hypothetical protein
MLIELYGRLGNVSVNRAAKETPPIVGTVRSRKGAEMKGLRFA